MEKVLEFYWVAIIIICIYSAALTTRKPIKGVLVQIIRGLIERKRLKDEQNVPIFLMDGCEHYAQ